MHIFDYSFLKNKPISSKFLRLSNVLYDLKNKNSSILKIKNNEFQKLKKIARFESIVESNELEGVFTTKTRLDEIINLNLEPLNHDEEEISGYKDAIDYVSSTYDSESLSIAYIKSLHKKIMSRHLNSDGGEYKKEDNYIIKIDENGDYSVLFSPVKPEEVIRSMNNLFFIIYISKRR